MQNWVHHWQVVNKTSCQGSLRVSIFLETIVSVTKIIFTDKIVFSIQRMYKHQVVSKRHQPIFTMCEGERPVFYCFVQLELLKL